MFPRPSLAGDWLSTERLPNGYSQQRLAVSCSTVLWARKSLRGDLLFHDECIGTYEFDGTNVELSGHCLAGRDIEWSAIWIVIDRTQTALVLDQDGTRNTYVLR